MDPVQEIIAQQYYATTASRSHRPDHEYYERASAGLRRRIKGWLPSNNSNCLDLACGCGEMLYLLEQEGFTNTVGVDLCKAELGEARRFVNGQLECDDILEFLRKQPPQSYDFITAFNILEHLEKDVVKDVLTQASRVLKVGGSFVAMVPNACSPFGSLTRYWDFSHCLAFAPNNFKQLAVITGFENDIDFRECGPIPYGLKSVIRYTAWQLIRSAIKCWMLIEVADTRGSIYTMDMLVRLKVARKPG